MANKCVECNKVAKATDSLKCSHCESFFHHVCLEISVEDFKIIKQQKATPWKCPNCADPADPENKDGDSNSGQEDSSITNAIEKLKGYIDQRLKSMKEDILKQVKQKLEAHFNQIDTKTTKIEESITLFSTKYDEILVKIKTFEDDILTLKKEQEKFTQENKIIKNQLALVESKLDDMDQRGRACNVEIRGVPETQGENLVNIVTALAKHLNVSFDKSEMYTVFRTGRKVSQEKPRPIVAIFKNFISRSDFLRHAKEFNKKCEEKSARLKTDYLNMGLTSQPIYVSEHLTLKAKQFLMRVKKETKQLGYKFCWNSGNKIFAKKDESSEIFIVRNEEDLLNLS
ncbi:hypothetical protein O0L34_g16511 [Tuta absoluta]|nr:hypothetical protein O0L34_g16511 [Tuta absoluta]